MNLEELFILSVTVCGKGVDDIGQFEINGKIQNNLNIAFIK